MTNMVVTARARLYYGMRTKASETNIKQEASSLLAKGPNIDRNPKRGKSLKDSVENVLLR